MEQNSFNAAGGVGGAAPRRNRWHEWLFFLVLLILAILGIGGGIGTAFFLPLMTITLTQTGLTRSGSYVLSASTNPAPGQFQARYVTAMTSSSKTVSATGEQDIPATQAGGIITFYNSDNTTHQISAGTLIAVPHSSLQVITDYDVVIAAANLPAFGVVVTSGHVVQPGADGNIAAHSLKQFCCSDNRSIQVDNSAAFSGGQDAQHYPVVHWCNFLPSDTLPTNLNQMILVVVHAG